MPKVIFDMPNRPVKEVDLADIKTKEDLAECLTPDEELDPAEYRGNDYGEDSLEDKTFHIRVREEKIGYYTVEADTLAAAEREALYRLRGETEGEVCPAVDYEQFDPKEFE